jgi:asparagine synthase (glutamine-hydrolysing)
MAAIWGLWQHGASPDTVPALARMTQTLKLFGHTATWHAPHIALGRAIGNTLPEDVNDAQPLHLPNGDTLVASLRLDAREPLAAQLGCPLHLPDSELLAAAWLHWGPDTPRHLTGEFAFAVWQPRIQQLFCALDHLGLRSLYYAATPNLFTFATLPRALPVPRALHPDSLAASLAYLPETPQGTIFQNIRRIPAGHSLTACRGSVSLSRYWYPESAPSVRLPNDEAYSEAFREVLDAAVGDRLRSSASVGAMLSGGFDSGAVTSSAATLLGARGLPLPAFTGVPAAGFHGPVPADRFADESSHAAAVAAMYPNVRHSLVTPLAEFPLDLVTATFPRVDALGGSLSLAPNGAAMAAAHRAAGIRVVLNGVLGNLTISYNGLALIPQLVCQGNWLRWFREARALTRHAHFRWPGVCALSFGPQAPPFLWKWVQQRRAGAGSGFSRYAILNPRYFVSRRLHELAEERGFDPYCRPPADGHRLRIQLLTQRNNAIHNAAAEYRDPTGDKRLIEFCLGIPDDQFLRRGTTKFLIRSALRHRLPSVVLSEWRKGLCGADWHLRVAPYRDRFRDALDDIARSPFAAETLDLPRLRTLLDRWPSQWSSPAVQTEYGMGFCRAMQAGAFIRWVEKEHS